MSGPPRDQRPLVLLCGGLVLLALLQWRDLDLRLADRLYASQGMAWRLRHDPLFANLFHARVQQASKLGYLATAALAVCACALPRWRPWRRRLLYTLLAMTLCYALVTAGKTLLPVPCPWDLTRYGGYLPPGGWLQWQSGAAAVKGCFPSGHATGGYALFAWYFAARDARCPHARIVLALALFAGLALGLVQQLRGAHFLSHDVAAAAVCWTVCASLADRLLPAAAPSPCTGR
ncbi:MAG TPA: phosphatase PAP2 family protein [Gammaproteobacteria bacterium]|nr:phosphatase PAP2 family protein [Gammaproteobacteria bacterium]